MAGIYLHIPFCKQACNYCNFHFSTSLRQKDAMLQAIKSEILQTNSYLENETIDTIYFGGGTPSLLKATEIEELIENIAKIHTISKNPEITLEANPDDLTDDKIKALRNTTGVNRFSIGIQSFFDTDLAYMNRAHNATEAREAVKKAQEAGFHNLTIDLIYGTPTMNNEQWLENINIALDLDVPHISCYCLTVEPKTTLEKKIRKGLTQGVDEEQAIWQFETLMDKMQAAGFDHYEISNFGKPNFYARHNSNYWQGTKYLGIGPSAHSFDGLNRRHNIANNALYIKAISSGTVAFEDEILSLTQRYNEYVMISLRTIWGTDIKAIKILGDNFYHYFQKNIQQFISQNLVIEKNETYTLSRQGKLMADFIAMELFY